MAVNYAEKYSRIVDERFKVGALTSALVNYAYDWVGVSTVKSVFCTDCYNGGLQDRWC